MNTYNRREILSLAGISAISLTGLSVFSCSGVQRKDLFSALENEGGSRLSAVDLQILSLAATAPSGHNTQPWTVHIKESGVWIIGTERERLLPNVDPSNREALLSIGAFLENLVTAAASFNLLAKIRLTARSPFDETIAEVTFVKDSRLNVSAGSLSSRRVIRKGYSTQEISSADISYITQASAESFFFIPPLTKKSTFLEEATIEANKIQTWRDPAQEELSNWIRFSSRDAVKFRNGLTPESMEIDGIAGLYVRTFFNKESVMSEIFRKQSLDLVKKLVKSHGGWMIITSKDSSIRSLIQAGREFERMFLKLRARSIAIHPMTQILEESQTQSLVKNAIGITDDIQLILRTGYVSQYPDPVSLRMNVDQFVI